MTRTELEQDVQQRFGMGLYEFIKEKAGVDMLHDYEIARILKVNQSRICKLRRDYGIKRAKGFFRRFERTYGTGAVETFKKLIERPEASLTDVGEHFGFTREYARHVYKKIFGRPYTEAYRRKRFLKHKKRLAEKRNKSKRAGALMKVEEKMKSLRLPFNVTYKGNSYIIFTNGYKLGFRISSKPTLINKKEYFRINNTMRANEEMDFVICLCRKRAKDIHFIIPSTAMPKALVSLLPEANPEQSKYAQYKEAWHLLNHKNGRKRDESIKWTNHASRFYPSQTASEAMRQESQRV